jgi:hypothetical protein
LRHKLDDVKRAMELFVSIHVSTAGCGFVYEHKDNILNLLRNKYERLGRKLGWKLKRHQRNVQGSKICPVNSTGPWALGGSRSRSVCARQTLHLPGNNLLKLFTRVVIFEAIGH